MQLVVKDDGRQNGEVEGGRVMTEGGCRDLHEDAVGGLFVVGQFVLQQLD